MGLIAFKRSQRFLDIVKLPRSTFPHNDTTWALVGLQDTSSWLHIDAEGTGTMVVVLKGLKLWCVARPRQPEVHNWGNIRGIAQDHDPNSANIQHFQYEAILLGAGDCL